MKRIAIFMGMVALTLCVSLPAHAQNKNTAPTIRYCNNAKDIQGIWMLNKLYEQPVGKLTQEQKSNPHQYILFQNDGLYYTANPNKRYGRISQARNDLHKSSGKDVWQFIVGEQGVIYFYKNQVFSHSYYCGKVTKPGDGYRKGQIILTPTDAGNAQIYKTYQKVRGGGKARRNNKKKGKK